MKKENSNKNILITGGTKGIGKSIAKMLANEENNVYICARTEQSLIEISKEIPIKGYFCTDLSIDTNCEKLIKEMINKAGSIDILINNAGGYIYSPIENTESNDIKNLIDLNIKAPYILTKEAVRNMKESKWGRIVNIGSISGIVGEANASLYSMTKSAFIGFSKALALELATDNITVNTISPGWVETELSEKAIADSEFTIQEELEMIPQKRFIQPNEIANLVKYLISEEAKGLTGQNISLCAGLSAG